MKDRGEHHGGRGTLLFMTHHAPQGAWSSLTFGLPGYGVGIDHEALHVATAGDLLVAVSHPGNGVTAMPFTSGLTVTDYESQMAGAGGSNGIRKCWRFLKPSDLSRRLDSAVDTFCGAGMTFRVVAPRAPLTDPKLGRLSADALCPGLLLELEIDNSASDLPAFGFLGLAYRGEGRIVPMDWSEGAGLAGICMPGRWALAARRVEGEVWTIRDNSIGRHVEEGRHIIHNGGNEGGICMAVPPRSHRTLRAAFGFYHAGAATVGIPASYAFTRQFDGVEAVCTHVLEQADGMHAAAAAFAAEAASRAPASLSSVGPEIYGQVSQAYYANTSVLETRDGDVLYSVCDGQFAWRNALAPAADHLPFELWRHPWVVRNVMDLNLRRYAYEDRLRFADDPDGRKPGGMSFTHDQGNSAAYSPPGQSGYELPGLTGCYSHMTTEALLSGIYCAAGYALSGDVDWLKARTADFVRMLDSLEARDHYAPDRRNGILKGESDRVGDDGAEITTYDVMDEALRRAAGNLYIGVKAWCAAHLLEVCFERAGERSSAARALEVAARTSAALVHACDPASGSLPPNLLFGGKARLMAGIEPLSVPLFLGLGDRLARDRQLMDVLRSHARACLRPGVCIDSATGGLRLSSTSTITWASKAALCMFAAAELLGVDFAKAYPMPFAEWVRWLRESSAQTTLADQIDSESGRARGGAYSPRVVTAVLFLRSRL
jgi:hypothetical protein